MFEQAKNVNCYVELAMNLIAFLGLPLWWYLLVRAMHKMTLDRLEHGRVLTDPQLVEVWEYAWDVVLWYGRRRPFVRRLIRPYRNQAWRFIQTLRERGMEI